MSWGTIVDQPSASDFTSVIKAQSIEDGDYSKQLVITYLHEFGHHLGLGENELEARGLGDCLRAEIIQMPVRVQIGPHVRMLEYIEKKTGRHALFDLLEIFQGLPMRSGIYRKAPIEGMSLGGTHGRGIRQHEHPRPICALLLSD